MNNESVDKYRGLLVALPLDEEQMWAAFEIVKQMEEGEATEFIGRLTEALRIPNLEESIELLAEFGQYEGTELGELWDSLLTLYCRRDYLGEDSKLTPVLEAEIISQATWAKQNLELVEKTETYTKTFKTLEEIE